MLTRPISVEEVERTNTTMLNPNQYTGFMSRYNLYTMDVDRERNCYNCRDFGHITRSYRLRETTGQGRRLEYGGSQDNGQHSDNLNREKDLVVLD